MTPLAVVIVENHQPKKVAARQLVTAENFNTGETVNTISIQIPPQHTAELLALLQRWNSTAPVSTEVSSPAPTEPVISLETLRQELTKVSQAGKASQVKQLLTEFGARNVKEIKPTDFAAVLEKAGAL